jgi:biopolymer transport protein ExbD
MRRLTKARPRGTASGPLAPLVDVITILLVVLLKSYSVDAPVRPDDPDFALPLSASDSPVGPAIDIDVTTDAIYVSGLRTAASGYYLEHDDLLIEELYTRLQGQAGRAVNVRVDGEIPYALVRKVLFSAREAGVERLTLVAQSRAGL